MNSKPVTEFDIIAYASGRLAGFPEREREVEDWLEHHPEMRLRAEEYRSQDRAIRERYDSALTWPIPDRLLNTLEQPQMVWSPYLGTFRRAAAVVLLMLASALAGWFAAQPSSPTNPHLQALADGSLFSRGAFSDVRSLADLRNEPGNGSILADILPTHVSQVGPLAEGYSVVGVQQVGRDNAVGLRLLLSDEAGRRAFLFVQGRWQDDGSELSLATKDEVSLATWDEGPLQFALATSEEPDRTLQIARAIRAAVQLRLVEQTLQPAPAQPPQVSLPSGPQASAEVQPMPTPQ